ncbi:MAG: YihY/virulence factor BrkB family protein [Aureliella sp.]
MDADILPDFGAYRGVRWDRESAKLKIETEYDRDRSVPEPVRTPDFLSVTSLIRMLSGYVREVSIALRLAARRWQIDDGSSLAAGVAYYLALSIFPLLLLLTSGLGIFLKFTHLGHDAEVQILGVVAEHCSATLRDQIVQLLAAFEEQSVVGGPFGIMTAGAAAIGVFYQFERAFDRIWRIPRVRNQNVLGAINRILGKRLLAFTMLSAVGLAIVAIMIANLALTAVREWMATVGLGGGVLIFLIDATATLCLNTCAFAVLYKILPKRRVLWRDSFRTALLVSIVWEIGREVLCSYVIGTHYTTTYGVIGSFIALLLWVYWGVTILLFGAEYLQVISQRHGKPYSMFDPSRVSARSRLGMDGAVASSPASDFSSSDVQGNGRGWSTGMRPNKARPHRRGSY